MYADVLIFSNNFSTFVPCEVDSYNNYTRKVIMAEQASNSLSTQCQLA